jgi:hypothetical protein
MSFNRLLPHFCTIQLPEGKKIGIDSWGRPILEKQEPFESSCRFVEETIRNKESSGTDVIKSIYILLPKTTEVDATMQISNIVDENGQPVTTAKIEIDRITRQNARKKLHHYKVYLKGAE